MANEAQVAVRFAVKDAEAVRAALQKLGADGEQALRRFDTASKPLPKSLTAVSDVIGEMRGRAASLAGSTGLAGTVLLGLGPVGLAAAAGLGAVYLAFDKVSEGAKAFRAYARDVRDFANATNFTTTEVQALTDVFLQNGIAQDKGRAGLEKFALAREQARHGDGELYQSLRRTSAALAEEFATAQNAPEALGAFIKALQQADDTTRAFLARAAFGRGGVAFAQALLDVAGRGGLGAVEQAAIKAGSAIEDSIIQKQAQAAIAAERKAQLVERAWGKAYAEIASVWKDFKKNVLGLDDTNTISIRIAATLASNAQVAREGLFGPDDPMRKALAERDALQAQLDRARRAPASDQSFGGFLADTLTLKPVRKAVAPELPVGELERRLREKDQQIDELQSRSRAEAQRAERSVAVVDKPARSREDERADLERVIKAERDRLAVLGDTASATELLGAKDRELRLARANNVNVTKEEIATVREGYAIQLAARDVAVRAQLGVVTATELLTQKQRELNHQLAIRKMSEADYATALTIIRKEVSEVIKAQEVRASDFPNLVRLRQEAGDLRAQFDTGLASGLRSVTQELSPFNQSAATAAERLRNIGLRFADVVYQALAMKYAIQPLASLFGGGLSALFGGSTGGADASFAGVGASPYALGGTFDRGISGFSNSIVDRPTMFAFARGVGLMGEAGPEAIMPLARDRSGRLGVRGGGGDGGAINVSYAPVYNVTGSGPEIDRLMAERARERMEEPARIVEIVKRARSNRIL